MNENIFNQKTEKTMKNLLVSLVILVGCGDDYVEEPLEATCESFISDLYAVPNCGYWNTAENPPVPIAEEETLRWCKDVEGYINTQCQMCEELLREWLICRPTECTWDPYSQTFTWNQCWGKMLNLLNCDCDQQ